jgi:hypothetical protein
VSTCRKCGFVVLLALLAAGCYEFHLVGPEDPTVVSPPAVVSVQIVYRQPDLCENDRSSCDGDVVFFGSWMREGAEFTLTPDLSSRLWRGTALGVPVNFPPRDAPYEVRVFDPYLRDTSALGMTAVRLTVGGETLTDISWEGTPAARGLIYIDDNGQGHHPY